MLVTQKVKNTICFKTGLRNKKLAEHLVAILHYGNIHIKFKLSNGYQSNLKGTTTTKKQQQNCEWKGERKGVKRC